MIRIAAKPFHQVGQIASMEKIENPEKNSPQIPRGPARAHAVEISLTRNIIDDLAEFVVKTQILRRSGWSDIFIMLQEYLDGNAVVREFISFDETELDEAVTAQLMPEPSLLRTWIDMLEKHCRVLEKQREVRNSILMSCICLNS